MPWNYNQQAIRVGRGWTNNDGIKHPYNWNNWTAETKAAQGLVWAAAFIGLLICLEHWTMWMLSMKMATLCWMKTVCR